MRTVTGTVDDDSGYDLLSFELWDDGELKDSKDIRVEVGSTENVSITLSFNTLYGTEAPGVGVFVPDLDFEIDPFYPTDESGSCYGTQTLSVSTLGTGNGIVKSSPVGIDCGSDCSENYTSDSIITLTATAESNSTFVDWSGDCSGTSPTCTVKMRADKDVTAEFAISTMEPGCDLTPILDVLNEVNSKLDVLDELNSKITNLETKLNEVIKPSVTLFKINNGASSTTKRTVTLNNTATNSPTHYMASESSSFSGASWLTYSASPSFTLSSAKGIKTVYFKVQNSAGESSKVSDTITLN